MADVWFLRGKKKTEYVFVVLHAPQHLKWRDQLRMLPTLTDQVF